MYYKLSTIISNLIKYLYISVFHIGNAEPALCQLDQLLPTQPRASGVPHWNYLLSVVQVHTTAHVENSIWPHTSCIPRYYQDCWITSPLPKTHTHTNFICWNNTHHSQNEKIIWLCSIKEVNITVCNVHVYLSIYPINLPFGIRKTRSV